MQPSDLLRRIRWFVLVEGEHDEIVLSETIGDQLAEARASMIPLRGGRNLKHSVDSRFLCDYTDARLLAVLDATRTEPMREIWRQAKSTNASVDFDAAKHYLIEALPGKEPRTEEGFMREYFIEALKTGQESRVAFSGMSQPDIIMYLDPELFVKGSDWETLYQQFNTQLQQDKQPTKSFKPWLQKKYKLAITPEMVRTAARQLDEIPPDIGAVVAACSI